MPVSLLPIKYHWTQYLYLFPQQIKSLKIHSYSIHFYQKCVWQYQYNYLATLGYSSYEASVFSSLLRCLRVSSAAIQCSPYWRGFASQHWDSPRTSFPLIPSDTSTLEPFRYIHISLSNLSWPEIFWKDRKCPKEPVSPRNTSCLPN